ncbi:MAG: FtsX-like permease family protein [Actinomycetia bacterium]|nr:FtsX-like permease family protein [Actinomycetes bacterium]
MKARTISLNSLKRRKAKSFFIICGLTVGIATIIALFTAINTMESNMDKQLDEYGANIVIFPKSDSLSLSYGNITFPGISFNLNELEEKDIEKIRNIKNKENINIVAPKLIGVIPLGNKEALLAGVDFESESRLKKWWKIDGDFPQDGNEILVGSLASEKFNLNKGEDVEVNGFKLKVTGIIKETGSQDDKIIFSDLKTSQKILDKKGSINMIEVSAWCYSCPIEEIVSQIKTVLPNGEVSAIKQTIESKMATITVFKSFSFNISIILLLIGSLIVGISVMSSVDERTKEIGIFRAIGFRKRHVIGIILFEISILSLIGGVVGYLIGMATSSLIVKQIFTSSVTITFQPELLLLSIILSQAVGLTSGLIPALKASKMDPWEALRHI